MLTGASFSNFFLEFISRPEPFLLCSVSASKTLKTQLNYSESRVGYQLVSITLSDTFCCE